MMEWLVKENDNEEKLLSGDFLDSVLCKLSELQVFDADGNILSNNFRSIMQSGAFPV